MMFGPARSTDELLDRKRGGYFRIEAVGGRQIITVHRVGEPEEVILCVSPGHANQMCMALTDEGLAGFVAGAA